MGRDPAGLLIVICVLLQIIGACGMCNITYTEPFCDPSRPECVSDSGDE